MSAFFATVSVAHSQTQGGEKPKEKALLFENVVKELPDRACMDPPCARLEQDYTLDPSDYEFPVDAATFADLVNSANRRTFTDTVESRTPEENERLLGQIEHAYDLGNNLRPTLTGKNPKDVWDKKTVERGYETIDREQDATQDTLDDIHERQHPGSVYGPSQLESESWLHWLFKDPTKKQEKTN